MFTYGIIELIKGNSILFLGLIVFVVFMIALAIFFISIYLGYNKPKDKKNKQNAIDKRINVH